MNTISMENAIAISEKHKLTDKIDDAASLYEEENLSARESCAALTILFSRSLRKTPTPTKVGFGAKVSNVTINNESYYQVRRGEEVFLFQEIPSVLLKALGCKQQNCHQNCINASMGGLPGHAIIYTSEISVLPQEKTNLDGILHSYVQLGEIVFDLDLGIRMSKDSYYKLFNVKEISSLEASKVQKDIAEGTLAQLSKNKVSTEVYLMSRDACAKTVTTGK